ncbi:MAG: hypothetical protein ACXWLB_16980 [Reyranella sp.]
MLSGAFNIGMSDKLDEQGGGKMNHYAWTSTSGETVVQVHGQVPSPSPA